jgi:hypothetical protein
MVHLAQVLGPLIELGKAQPRRDWFPPVRD